MKNKRVPKVDPHIDVADMYHLFHYRPEDFLSEKDLPVTLAKLQQANISFLGTTLYFDQSFVQTDFYSGVNDFYKWYEQLFSMSKSIYPLCETPRANPPRDEIACFYTIEGLQCLRSPQDLFHFLDLGVKVFGLTWSTDNQYACGRHSKNDRGLSAKGNEVVGLMSRENIILDIAHLSQKSVQDAAKIFEGPIVSTHGNTRSVFPSTHNLTDDEIQLIVDRGGVVSLFPLSNDTGAEGTLEELYHHVDYIASNWGDDYVAFSSDIYPLEQYPFLEGYEDVLVLNAIEDYLLTRLSRNQVKKLFYDNWLRLLKPLFLKEKNNS